MSDNKINDDKAIEVWGEQSEIMALGERLRVMLPNGNQLSPDQAMALAQYSKLADANPFRGEIYAAVIRGQVRFIDGYKLLVRWAKRKEAYTDKYVEWNSEEKVAKGRKSEDIAYTCWIMLDSKQKLLFEYLRAGVALSEAYELLAFSATGVVTKKEDMTGYKDGRTYDIEPPKGWTWHDVAKKRALKNALNVSHGAPSPSEIAMESWKVGSTDTSQSDWDDIPEFETDDEVRAKYAVLAARTREQELERSKLPEGELRRRREENSVLLHGEKENGIGIDRFVTEEQVFPVLPIVTNAELITDALEGEEVIVTDIVDEPARNVSLDEAKRVCFISYKSAEGASKALKALLNFGTLEELNPVHLWNFYQYTLRRDILNNVNIVPIEYPRRARPPRG